MRWLRRPRTVALIVALCALLAAGGALAQDAQQSNSAEPTSPTVSGGLDGVAPPVAVAAEPRRSILSQHWFKGLLCASFLLVCGLAGANDRLEGDAPKADEPQGDTPNPDEKPA